MRDAGPGPCPHRHVERVAPRPVALDDGRAHEHRITLLGVCRQCGQPVERPARARPAGPWRRALERPDAA